MLPIRKINPTTVGLTSYYGKAFVTRSARKANSSLEWLIKHINIVGYSEDTTITDLAPADVFDNNFHSPYIYGALSNFYKSFRVGDLSIVLDHTDRVELTDPDTLKKVELDKYRLIGVYDSGDLAVVDYEDKFYKYHHGAYSPLGDIYRLLSFQRKDAPLDVVELSVFSKAVPVGIVLGYQLGITNLLKLLGANYRVLESPRAPVEDDEFLIRFQDRALAVSRKDKANALILSGFVTFSKDIRRYTYAQYDSKDVYFNLLKSKKLGPIYLREIDSIFRLFIDPITESILAELDEPTTYPGLLIRASEMLLTYEHPDSQDLSAMRLRGYERIAGAVYKELSTAIRQYKNRNIAGKSKVDIGHYQVWNAIAKDNSIKNIEDINPIQNLKEYEVVTYVGSGGRSKDSINRASRAFHKSDIGVISEATVDSTSVGINAYMSADPNLEDLRGLVKVQKDKSPTSLLSTTALLSPGSNHDDVKRVNFASIMASHVVSTTGYRQPHIKTGYEYIVPSRTSDLFAYMAKDAGKIVSLDAHGIVVEYQDGSRKGVTLGTSYGKAEGSIYPHEVVSELKVGDKVSKGDAIAYNTNFFEHDFLDPKRIMLRSNINTKTALYESNQTYEDSSVISKRLAGKLSTTTIKLRSVTVDFDQDILEVLKKGAKVTPNDVLMLIEDEITRGSFDKTTLAALKDLATQAPKAKYLGVVDKVEVYYNGDKADMSPGLKKVTDASDRLLSLISKSSERPVVTGRVSSDYSIKGSPLLPNRAEVKFYITVTNAAGVGDKGIFANQLKSTFAEVMEHEMHTESGDQIDSVFGYKSISARIVNSPVIIGTTTTLLKVIARQAVQIYKG